jgi:FkbM family methyltransferase
MYPEGQLGLSPGTLSPVMELPRQVLRSLVRSAPFPGRYRLVEAVGPLLGKGHPSAYRLNGVRMELDHGNVLHRLIYYGLYEENVMNHLRRALRPGDTVIDPGANIGYFAAECLGLVGSAGRVISLEPSNTAFSILGKNNPSPPANWIIEQAGLTDHTGEMTFYDTPRVITRGFACLEGVFEPKDRVPHQVRVFALDDYCAERGISRIAFLKLDIEGSELKALQGAARLLNEGAIRTILVETSLEAHLRPNAGSIDGLLRSAGYRSHRAKRNGVLVPIDVMDQKELREDILWTLA